MNAPARPRWKRLLLVASLLPSLLAGPGCTRAYYRNWTDKEVDGLLREKAVTPITSLEGYHVYPNPEARFADISKPDRPPMPPDDPEAKALSPNPQHPPHKAGVALIEGIGYLDRLDAWDRQNRAELPDDGDDEYQKSFSLAEKMTARELADAIRRDGPLSEEQEKAAVREDRTFLLKLEQAVELGLINSREYQTRREALYLAALPVTLERFAFTPQFYAAETYLRERFGAGTPEGRTNRVRWNSDFSVSKLFSTGGLLLLSFANRTVINIGSDPTTSVSTVSLDLIQPLLRGAGRAVTLEPLTQTERNLLYAVRDYAKFRQEFFVFIAAGQPAFIPGVQAGVSAVTGGTIGIGGPPTPGAAAVVGSRVPIIRGPQIVPGDGQRFSAINPGGATPQGYLSTLGEKAQLINQYRNIQALRKYFNLFQVYLEGGIVNSVQVGQVEQQLLRSIDGILSDQANYRNSVDQFKQQLGLPMKLRLDVADGPLRPVLDQTRRFEQISGDFERISQAAANYAKPGEEGQLRGRLEKLLTEDPAVAKTKFPAKLKERWADWKKEATGPKDLAGRDPLDRRIEKLVEERRKLETKRDELEEKEEKLSDKDAARLEELDFEVDLGRFEKALRAYASKYWEAEKDAYRRALMQSVQFNVAYRQFLAMLEVPFRERRDGVRTQWPDLPPLCIEGVDLLADDDEKVLSTVVRVALENRLDLMNQRAQLVDSWRKLTVSSNALMAALDVQYHGDVSTPLGAARPLDFGYNRWRHQLIINGELPLVRIAERNLYRTTIIAYQQQRRALQQAEDNVAFAVRLELRQLRAAAVNYHKVQKRNVELAYTQVDQALQAFSQPQTPAGPAAPAGSVGPPTASGGSGDPAALTQQLLSAQNSLLGAVNGLYNTWLNYLTTRMSLYRDLGVMPLDQRGVWTDDAANCCPPGLPPTDPPGKPPAELPAPRPAEGEK